MPEQFLPLINEVFEEHYDNTAVITSFNNEFYNKDGSKVVSDTAFMVNHMVYHFECQFSNDKEMAFRMFEYDFQIGLSNSKRQKKLDEFDFPRSCVVYITTNSKNPKKLSMKVNFPNGQYVYEVPTIRVHDYSLEHISKKKLLIFGWFNTCYICLYRLLYLYILTFTAIFQIFVSNLFNTVLFFICALRHSALFVIHIYFSARKHGS